MTENFQHHANEMPKPTIKGLYEKLGVSKEEIEELRRKRAENGMRLLKVYSLIISRGGNIHSSDPVATAKRRAANKRARKQRKINGR